MDKIYEDDFTGQLQNAIETIEALETALELGGQIEIKLREALAAAERRAKIAEEALGSACVRLAPHILAVDARWKSCFDHDPRPTESELTAELVEHFKTLAEAELYPDDAPTADEMARETEGAE